MHYRWKDDLRGWGADEETLDELEQLYPDRPDVVMAYRELVNPETFAECYRYVRRAINVTDEEQMEDYLVGSLAQVLRNLIDSPGEYRFEDRTAVRRFLRGVLRIVCLKLINYENPHTPVGDKIEGMLRPLYMHQQSEYLRFRLQDLLSQLNRKFAKPTALYIAGYTIAEISEILDIPEGTVKSRLSRARQQIRKLHLLGGW